MVHSVKVRSTADITIDPCHCCGGKQWTQIHQNQLGLRGIGLRREQHARNPLIEEPTQPTRYAALS